MDLLPATTYVSPSRQGRMSRLNTIIEDREDASSRGYKSDSEGCESDKTIIGRPAGLDSTLFVAAQRNARARIPTINLPTSVQSSPCSSAGEGLKRNSFRGSISDASDAGTVFSDASCPSLAGSLATSIATDSSRNSFASTTSGRNRYPALIIPRDSWGSISDSPLKELGLGISPSTKVRLTPTMLASLQRPLPAINHTPSLGESSSIASCSPCMTNHSVPSTPDLHSLEISDLPAWKRAESSHGAQSLEIAIDEHHSLVLSPADAHSSVRSSHNFSDIVVNFPKVPGATPQEMTPVEPDIRDYVDFGRPAASDTGVELPSDALKLLDALTRQSINDEPSPASAWEMRERSQPPSRRRSLDAMTPASDYSLDALSIPSPGGFFSSLKGSTRQTWYGSGSSRDFEPPSSTTAENFYNTPWSKPEQVIETLLEVDETNLTEGPPTVRQVTFAEPSQIVGSPVEDDDLYGPANPSPPEFRSEYDEAYEDGLKEAAETNKDRTGGWLAEQNAYLSIIRESNPMNDPADYPATPGVRFDSPVEIVMKQESSTDKAIEFLEKAAKVSTENAIVDSTTTSPFEEKDFIFLDAYKHLSSKRKRRDAFVHASSRFDAVTTDRVSMPEKHISDLLGQHTIIEPRRFKYSGPFSQNPRATGCFSRTAEQVMYSTAERQKAALDSIMPSTWQTEALRALLDGRLLAAPVVHERLNAHSKKRRPKPLRILDLGGKPTASWAWDAAHQWPSTRIYTVNTQEQTKLKDFASMKPATPTNHRFVSTPTLWQLPFRSDYFDVVSARSLHSILKANPVPGVASIDEWDLTLKECMRVLKPGGYLDFMVMDSSIAHAGPRGEAMSVEFGFELHRRGYERDATKALLRKLKKNGFEGCKRAWMFMPMGKKIDKDVQADLVGYTGNDFDGKPRPAPRPVSEVSSVGKIVEQYYGIEAVQGLVGGTADVADVTGLLGAWMWEEWVVKLRAEMGREKSRWLEGNNAVIEEGREYGSGWRMLTGWARKPKPLQITREKPVLKSIQPVSSVQPGSPEDGSMSTIDKDGKWKVMGEIPMIIQEEAPWV